MTTASLIFAGGSIVTIDPVHPEAEALAVADDRIAYVGSLRGALKFKGEATKMVDLRGGALLPGFIEAHGHPLYSALGWGDPVVDIRPTKAPTYQAMADLVRARVAEAKPGEFLWFLGLDPTRMPDAHEPSKEEMDAWAPDNPIVIQLFSFHSCYINTQAASRCGLNGNTIIPGGEIDRDAKGEPWKLKELAQVVPQLKFFDECGQGRMLRELDSWLWKYAAAGYTTSAEIGLRPGWHDHYMAYREHFAAPIRIRAYELGAPDAPPVSDPRAGDGMYKVIGMKMLADGSLFVGNIALTRPYHDSAMTRRLGINLAEHGHFNWSREKMLAMVSRFAADGWQMAIHTQGDAATDAVLDCYEEVLAKYPDARRPFRLEHCSVMRLDQVERAVALGVVVSFYNTLFYEWGEVICDDLFGPRQDPYLPAGSAARQGMRISYHCDSPMTWPNALACVQFGVTRQTQRGHAISPSEGVGIDVALKAVTIDAAFQLQMEEDAGSLEVGKLADLVWLEKDPRRCDPVRLIDIPVLATYVGGKPVFQNQPGQPAARAA